jgi:Thermolysin metallopeptidase, alpha-helical domain/Thermolysin metallopeptidase, catalytic domain
MDCQHDDHRHSLFCILPPHMLESIAESSDAKARKWAIRTLSADASLRTRRVAVQAAQGVMAAPPPSLIPHKQRLIYDAAHGSTLPGTVKRTEAHGPVGDAEVDEAYDGLGATFDLYWNVYHRNSIDNAGMNLVGTVHYLTGYDNAFWNGSQMVFGDGDGTYFNRFTIAIDVMGHELTHGVTAHQANLAYHDQPGALNESMSDVFGSLVKQYAHNPKQKASQADWLIGAGIFTPKVNGKALRSMKDPGTAYDDKVLGKDPQPAHMSNYVVTTSDNGGVHINSGIPNRAFYLLAVALGGYAWEKAGLIWYRTLCDSRLSTNAQFQDFANLTADNAGRLFGATEQQAVIDAWQRVGILVTAAAPKISGNWVLHYSWGPTSNYAQVTLDFKADGTFAGGAVGRWTQQDGTLLLSFNTGPAKYAGNVDANVGAGAMSTFGGLDGTWYLSKVGVVGLSLPIAPAIAGMVDAAGTVIGAPKKAEPPKKQAGKKQLADAKR